MGGGGVLREMLTGPRVHLLDIKYHGSGPIVDPARGAQEWLKRGSRVHLLGTK